MRVLHIIPNFHLGEPQLAVLEFARVARMRGLHASVLALSDEGQVVRTMLERHMIPTQSINSDAEGALAMQLLQKSMNVVQTHSLEDLSKVLPAVADMNLRLVHVFHTCMSRSGAERPAGNGYLDSVSWVRATQQDDRCGMSELGELPTILDGVWLPPLESLSPLAHRQALELETGEFCIGAEICGDPYSDLEELHQLRTRLSNEGVDARIVVFGGADALDVPDGFTVVSDEDTSYTERLAGLDAFVQLKGNDFCQLSLLAMARRVPVVLPEPEVRASFRGGWSPYRFAQRDADSLATQLMKYVRYPDMHEAHRSLVRDYVLTFRDSMSMVGSYARFYDNHSAERMSL